MPNDNISLLYNAKPHLFEKAKALRLKMTTAEKIFWNQVRNKNFQGLRFKRQHPIDIFIADFYCHQLKLVVEIDGEIHNTDEQKEHDNNPTAELNRLGIEVIRFTNEEVTSEIDKVLEALIEKCEELRKKN